SIRNSSLFTYQHQRKLSHPIDTTTEIYETATQIFREMWQRDPIRHIGIHLSELAPSKEHRQCTMFDNADEERLRRIDATVDRIREAYGDDAVIRGVFANSRRAPILGGVNNGNYLMMGGHSL
ncbi:MAG: DNA polymerase IV, partial [Clostridiales Family XIII bacterium]|nr:DNA polymerase IV [Clostridiales Family XIII bacterium]